MKKHLLKMNVIVKNKAVRTKSLSAATQVKITVSTTTAIESETQIVL